MEASKERWVVKKWYWWLFLDSIPHWFVFVTKRSISAEWDSSYNLKKLDEILCNVIMVFCMCVWVNMSIWLCVGVHCISDRMLHLSRAEVTAAPLRANDVDVNEKVQTCWIENTWLLLTSSERSYSKGSTYQGWKQQHMSACIPAVYVSVRTCARAALYSLYQLGNISLKDSL